MNIEFKIRLEHFCNKNAVEKNKSKKYRYQAIKQKEQSKLKTQKARHLHEIRRHK